MKRGDIEIKLECSDFGVEYIDKLILVIYLGTKV